MNLDDNDIQKMLAGVKIPPCPALLLEVMKEAKRPDAAIERIAQPIKRDAGMAAALLKLANSPLYARGARITSVNQALSVLGMKVTVNLLNNVALIQSMANDPPSFEKFWERSSLGATVSARLAKKLNGISQDDAYITGLFHDCGIPVLMRTYPDYREVMTARAKGGKAVYEVEDEVYSTNHAVVGSMMARSWFLPDNVSKAILYHHDKTIYTIPGSHVTTEIIRLIGVVHMAELVVDEHFCQHSPDWEAVAADVLHYFDMSEQDFSELKDDTLDWLNQE
ncbi:MAG: HDOD domain-containing protein [Sideroxydans sp.]|nr:HDOD domain-containing protein [Sideroxydans sp.]